MRALYFFRIVTMFCIYCLSVTDVDAQRSLDLNVGLSGSKSVLGVSYTVGKNQLNIGLRGFSYSGRDGFYLQPGVSFNRYFTENGFYAWLAYIPEYRSHDAKIRVFDSSGNGMSREIVEHKGWKPGILVTGIGKSWQFTRWGLHADLGVSTPAASQFGTEVGVHLGGAVSYRFRLGH